MVTEDGWVCLGVGDGVVGCDRREGMGGDRSWVCLGWVWVMVWLGVAV